jgi:2-alkyl-3-oxoalkanoate reductase
VRVLVTGATGFVGGRVVRRLREQGHEVVALVRSPDDGLTRLGVEQQVADLTDVAAVTVLAAGATGLVHTAASVDDDLARARHVNRDGTAAVVAAALGAGVGRLVHVSTTSVYERPPGATGEISEDHPLVSSGSVYAVTKAEAETEVARGAAEGLPALVLRPPAVLGAGPTSTWGTRVPARVRDGTLPPRDPTSTFAWVHVEDLVDAVLGGLDAAATATVNVVGGHTTVGAYLERVGTIVGRPPPEATTEPPGWRGQLAARRLSEVLGIDAERGFDAAMEEIAAAWASRSGP